MTGLPWVRLDSTIYTHDKILALLEERQGYRACTLYLFSLGYAGSNETDGYITRRALTMLHGTAAAAALLVKHHLWMEADDGGWWIRNYANRQALEATKQLKGSVGGIKRWIGTDPEYRWAIGRTLNCTRWHDQPCPDRECARARHIIEDVHGSPPDG